MHIADFPRQRYTDGDTAIEYLPRLSAELNGPNIYIKRDDQLGLAAGGNKTRKLEFLMADAISHGADTIITTGGVQSNHCRLTLSAAAKEGLNCRLLLQEHLPDSYDSEASGNNLLYKILGADSVEVIPRTVNSSERMKAIADNVTAAGGIPYIIPGGGSSPRGALGYVVCADEILAQAEAMSVTFDHVVCASGSGGTQAGLITGFARAKSDTSVTGVSISASRDVQEGRVFELITELSALLDAPFSAPRELVTVLDEYVGPGYTLPTPEMAFALRFFAQKEGILLDPVYSGKAAAGLIQTARLGEYAADSNVLFLHTGGSPAIYAHPDAAFTR